MKKNWSSSIGKSRNDHFAHFQVLAVIFLFLASALLIPTCNSLDYTPPIRENKSLEFNKFNGVNTTTLEDYESLRFSDDGKWPWQLSLLEYYAAFQLKTYINSMSVKAGIFSACLYTTILLGFLYWVGLADNSSLAVSLLLNVILLSSHQLASLYLDRYLSIYSADLTVIAVSGENDNPLEFCTIYATPLIPNISFLNKHKRSFLAKHVGLGIYRITKNQYGNPSSAFLPPIPYTLNAKCPGFKETYTMGLPLRNSVSDQDTCCVVKISLEPIE